jgi:CobQ-like glutamine amidotransferase family enzyme
MVAYKLNFAHLYGDLMNTYGDWGNILALNYYAKKIGVETTSELISLGDKFDDKKYDFVLFGGGQDYEETVVARDIPDKAKALSKYIENGGSMLAVCGGFQLLGHYMTMADGTRVDGISIMDHFTENMHYTKLKDAMRDKRLIGNIQIKNPDTGEIYHGFENHQGRTFLGKDERPLGEVVSGFGNNGDDGSEGVIYKNVYGSYFHGPVLTRNGNLAKRILGVILTKKYPKIDWIKKLDGIPTESF